MENVLPSRAPIHRGMSLEGVHLFPVRHHSPRSASCLRAWLQTVQPELILVERPSDAESLIPVLTDPESQPPIAILGKLAS